ncbi:MAG: hypothetical protein PHV82_04895 [Victivallaceae bacterium]|nr:hypothetical protein [Victivallaceae bacterium]
MIKGFLSDVRSDACRIQSFLLNHKSLFILVMLAVVFLTASSAHAEVTLPTTVDVTEYITAGITAMALIVAAALGGYTAFLLIRKAFRWLGRALG